MRAILFLLPLALLQADTYSVTDLGSLGGSSTVGFQINNSGTVVGWGESSTGEISGFVYSGAGGTLNLPALPGGTDTYAYGSNSSGTVVGISYINGQAHGVIWNGGVSTDMGAGVFATGINDAGAVIGGNGHAFVLVNGVYQDLGTLQDGNWSTAEAINNGGTVVGYGNIGNGGFRGFVWTPGGGMVQIGTFGGMNSYATGVNDSGEVVGHAALANGYENAFLEVGGVMTDLGTLGGGNSYAYGVNDSGTVVGYSWTATGAHPDAFVYMDGVMTDLNSLIPSDSGWQLLEAYGINSAGEIVGEGLFDGQAHAFLLDPEPGVEAQVLSGAAVPEPRTEWLVGVCLALVCWRVSRRQAKRSL